MSKILKELITRWSVSESDQLQVVSPLLQCGLQDLLVLPLLLQQLLQESAKTRHGRYLHNRFTQQIQDSAENEPQSTEPVS